MCLFLGVFKGSCVSVMPWQLNGGHFDRNFSKKAQVEKEGRSLGCSMIWNCMLEM